VRLEFSLEQFWEEGGCNIFVHRMAAVLEVHYADIRVVGVYRGSTVVEFEVA
jgi:hypothetical protein